MRQLTVAQALTKDAIEKALAADLAVDAANSSDMVTFYLGRPRPGSRFETTVKRVDLRVPTSQTTAMGEAFLVIELREDSGITANDARSVLGRPTEISVPEPNGVTTLSYIYRSGRTGRISVGLVWPSRSRPCHNRWGAVAPAGRPRWRPGHGLPW
jgi:hypothetical protein